MALASASMIFPTLARAAAEAAAPAPAAEKVVLGPPPSDFGLTFFYYADAEKVSSYPPYLLIVD